MAFQSDSFDDKDVWILLEDELLLLHGMTDTGRLGFSVQLKFRQIYGRYPESISEVPFDLIQSITEQINVTSTALDHYPLQSRQAQRHRQNIRDYLGVRLPKKTDITRLIQWLMEYVLPLNPQALQGFEVQ